MSNLTGKQLVEREIITGPIYPDSVQQHGVDLNLCKVEKVVGMGFVPKEGKTRLATRLYIPIIHKMIDSVEREIWELEPGTYDITFLQGCKIPPDQRLEIVQRSSILRNAGILRSSVFDAGFQTEQIGTIIVFNQPIQIERYARIAQIVAIQSNAVDNLYDGQWQQDKQRNS